VSDNLFSVMIAIDVFFANIWLACLLFLAGRAEKIDRRLGADTKTIDEVRQKVEAFRNSVSRMPTTADTIVVLAVGFGVTAVSHLGADMLAPFIEQNAPGLAQFSLTGKFFWIIVIATTAGLLLSFFPRVRALEGVGASRIGSALLYILVASIGMKMNLMAVFHQPGLFVVGLIWILFHAATMLLLAWLIKAPTFFLAVGSQANVGGAASASIVASAFHPTLAPVGVLLAVLGYALGTYGALLSGLLMRAVAPQ
jgi:uncharacterized membrane protein